MVQSVFNNVLVKIPHKYISNITEIVRASQMAHNTKINPADYVNIIGEVVSIPRKISDRIDYNGFELHDIKIGDRLLFRYDVVFAFLKNEEKDTPIFKNMFWYKGEEFWAVDIQKVFAVIRGEEIIMQNGYCMIEKMNEPSMLVLPNHMTRMVNAGMATLSQIGRNLSHLKKIDCNPGDRVYFNPLFVQNYQIAGKKFGIVKQKDIFGKKEPAEEIYELN
jgi:co-chaperonin GroES (HSP10)